MNYVAIGARGGRDTRIAFPAMSRDRYLAVGDRIAWVFVNEQDKQDFLQGWREHAPPEPEPETQEEVELGSAGASCARCILS